MRFIRKEEIITTICNEEVKKAEYISSLLEKLKEEGVYFALTTKKLCLSDYTDHIMKYGKVKVKQVKPDENKVDFFVYRETSLIIMNNITYDEISEIYALTQKNNLLDNGKNKGIFDYIDLED